MAGGRGGRFQHVLARIAFAVSVAAGLTPNAGTAQTLEDALSGAFCTNPELMAARSKTDVSAEKLTQAKAASRVRVAGEVYTGMAEVESEALGPISVHPSRYGLTLEKPLYAGGRLAAATRLAQSGLDAREAAVTGVEQRVFLATAEAYLSVRMQTEILEIRRRNVSMLAKRLEQARARFGEGEITLTDVAQSEARLAAAKAQSRAAEAMLESARASLRRVSGLDVTHPLPPGPHEFSHLGEHKIVELAYLNNPGLAGLSDRLDMADADLRIARSSLRPSASVVASVGRQQDQFPVAGETDVAQVGVRVRIPFYQGGAGTSRMREARAEIRARNAELADVRRRIVEGVQQALELGAASRERVRALETGIKAADLAVMGTSREAEGGQRTTLDVLDAEQELLEIRVDLLEARQDALIAEYRLMVQMGFMTAQGFRLTPACR